jgi:TatD DNase family protein
MEKLIDCHCHLDLYPDPFAVAREAVIRGVYVLSVTTTPTAFNKTSELAPENGKIRTALGLHPELAVKRRHELALFETLLPKTRFVGEVGLDGSSPHRQTLDEQAAILMEILLMCARSGGKIISLHSRGARARVLDLLGLEPYAGRPILHWFTGSAKEVTRASELGCWFSVGPAMLNSQSGRAAVAAMPKERVLPETDGPFGTANGNVAYPWDAMSVDQLLSDVWREPAPQIREALVQNFTRLVSAQDTRISDPTT